MNTLQVRRSLGEAEAAPDPSWRGLYKAGGVSGVLVGVLYIVATVLVFIMPQPPSFGRGCHAPIHRLKQVRLYTRTRTVCGAQRPGHGRLPGSLSGAQASEQELRCPRRHNRYRLRGDRSGPQQQLPIAQRWPRVPERSLRGSHYRCTTRRRSYRC